MQDVYVREPEGARQEGTVAFRQTVGTGVRAVAEHQAVDQQLALDRRHRAQHPRIAGGQEAHHGHEQPRGVEFRMTVALREGLAGLVERLGADIGVHALAQRPPAVERCFEAEALRILDGAIHRDPGHHLGIGEMPAVAARFPDAVVRLLPDSSEVLGAEDLHRPRRVWISQTASASHTPKISS